MGGIADKLLRSLLIMAFLSGTWPVGAQVVPGGPQAPRMDAAANGTKIVKINTPNGSGVSNNTYDQFNVAAGGLVLNNSATVTTSALAGYIDGNANLKNGSASVIINQVVGASNTSLAGYLEVAGSAAQVIVANSNGISCTGCGFINSPWATLTTGTPTFGAAGDLAGFAIDRGTITVGGAGLDASGMRLDLLSRASRINAGIWAAKLNVAAGAAEVTRGGQGDDIVVLGRSSQQSAPEPAFALDVAAIGGMYAGAIRLIGTEAGLGVRIDGSVASLDTDWRLTSAGRVEIAGQAVSAGQMTIAAPDISIAGTAYGQGDMRLSADRLDIGGLVASASAVALAANQMNVGGKLFAGLDADGSRREGARLTVGGGALTLSGSAITTGALDIALSEDLTTSGVVQASGATGIRARQFSQAGDLVNLAGPTTIAASRLIQSGTLLSTSTDTLTVQADSVDLTGGQLGGGGGIALIADKIAIDRGASLVADGDLSATIGTTIIVDGILSSRGAMSLGGGGAVATREGGRILAGGQATIETPLLTLDHGTVSASSLHLAGGALRNDGGQIEATGSGSSSILLSGALSNRGTIITNGSDLAIAAQTIANAGTLAHAGDGRFTVTSRAQFDGRGGTIGSNGRLDLSAADADLSGSTKVTAAGDLALATSRDLTVDGATIAAGGDVDLSAGGLLSGVGVGIEAGRAARFGGARVVLDGARVSADRFDFMAGQLSLRAAMLSQRGTGDFTIATTGTLDYSGATLTARGENFTIAADRIVNAGGGLLHAGTGLFRLTATGAIDNRDGRIATNGSLALRGASLDNSGGSATALGAATLSLSGAAVNDQGLIQAGQGLSIDAASLDQDEGTIEAAGAVVINVDRLTSGRSQINSSQSSVDLTATASAVIRGGGIAAAHDLSIDAGSIRVSQGSALNAGRSQSLAARTGALNVEDASRLTGGSVALEAATLLRVGGAAITADDVVLRAQTLEQTGRVTATRSGRITIAGDAYNSGLIQTDGGDLQIKIGSLTNSGTIANAGAASLGIDAASVTNSGLIASNGALAINGQALTNTGTVSAQRAIDLALAGNLANDGAIISAGTLRADLGTLANMGTIAATGTQRLAITTRGGLKSSGVLGGNGDVVLSASSIDLSQASAGGTLTAAATAGDLRIADGRVAARDITLSASRAITVRNGGSLETPGLARITANILDLEGPGSQVLADRLTLDAHDLRIASGGQFAVSGQDTLDITLSGAFTLDTGLFETNADSFSFAADTIAIDGSLRLHGRQSASMSGSNLTVTGVLSSNGDLALSGDRIGNSGTIGAVGAIALSGTSTIDNSGAIVAGGQLRATGGSISSSGTLAGLEGLSIRATSLDADHGRVLAGDFEDVGSRAQLDIVVTGALSARSGLVAATGDATVSASVVGLGAGGRLTGRRVSARATAGDLDARGGQIDGTNLVLSATGAIKGSFGADSLAIDAATLDMSGEKLVTRKLSGRFDALTNVGGIMVITGSDALDWQLAGAFDNRDGSLETNASTLTIAAASIDNRGGAIRHAGADRLDLTALARLDNDRGAIASNGRYRLDTVYLANTAGTIAGLGNSTVRVTRTLSNLNGMLSSNGGLDVVGGDILNGGGTLSSSGALSLAGETLDNRDGAVTARGSGALDIDLTGSVDNRNEGLIGSGGAISVRAASFANTGGVVSATDAMALTLTSLDNGGDIVAGGALSLTASGAVANGAGVLQAQSLALSAAELGNAGGTVIGADSAQIAVVGTVDNAGLIQTDRGALRIDATRLVNSGTIAHAGEAELRIAADLFDNRAGARIASNGALSLGGGSASNAGSLSAQRRLDLALGGALDNRGTVITSGPLSATLGSLDNTGTIAAIGSGLLDLRTAGALTSSGTLAGNGAVTLEGAAVQLASASAVTHLTATASAGDLIVNGGRLTAADLTLGASGVVAAREGGSIETAGRATIGAASLEAQGSNSKIVVDTLALTARNVRVQDGAAIAVTGENALDLSLAGDFNVAAGSFETNAARFSLTANRITVGGDLRHHGQDRLTLGAGTIGVSGTVSTNGAMTIGGDRITNSGVISALDGLDLTAVTALANSGQIVAGGALTARGGALTSSGTLAGLQGVSIGGTSLNADGGRVLAGDFAKTGDRNTLDITTTGMLSARGGLLAATGDATVTGRSILLSNGGRLTARQVRATATAGDLDAAGGQIDGENLVLAATGKIAGTFGADSIAVSSALLDISGGQLVTRQLTGRFDALANRGGSIVITGTDALDWQLGGAFDNRGGTLRTNATSLTMAAGSILNGGGTIDHAGTGLLDLTSAATLDNSSGAIATNGRYRLVASDLTNDGGAIAAPGSSVIGVTNTLSNIGGTLSSDAGLDIDPASIVNRNGTISSGGPLILAGGTLDNRGGKITAVGVGGLTLALTGALDNSGAGLIGSRGDLTLGAGSLGNAGGLVTAADAMTLTLGSLDNGGEISAGGALDVTASGAVTNRSGTLQGISLTVDAGSFSNDGGKAIGTNGANFAIARTFDNASGSIGGDGSVAIGAGAIANGGTIAGTDVQLTASGTITTAAGSSIWASHDLTLSAASLTNAGSVAAEHDLSVTGTTINNAAGVLGGGNKVALDFTNATLGNIAAPNDLALTVRGNWSNAAGQSFGAARDLTLTVTGSFDNAGTVTANGAATITAGTSFTNRATGTIKAGSLTASGGGAFSNAGVINTAGAASLSGATFSNSGQIFGTSLTLTSNGAFNNLGSDAVIATRSGPLVIGARGTITNADGAMLYSLGDLKIAGLGGAGRAGGLINSSATIQAAGNGHIAVGQLVNTHTTFETREEMTRSAGYTGYRPEFFSGEIPSSDPNFMSGYNHVRLYWDSWTTRQVLVADSGEGRIIVGGNLAIDQGKLDNLGSTISAGGNLTITGGPVRNEAIVGTEVAVEDGFYMAYSHGGDHWGGYPTPSNAHNRRIGNSYHNETLIGTIELASASITARGSATIDVRSLTNAVLDANGQPVGAYSRTVSANGASIVATGGSAQTIAGASGTAGSGVVAGSAGGTASNAASAADTAGAVSGQVANSSAAALTGLIDLTGSNAQALTAATGSAGGSAVAGSAAAAASSAAAGANGVGPVSGQAASSAAAGAHSVVNLPGRAIDRVDGPSAQLTNTNVAGLAPGQIAGLTPRGAAAFSVSLGGLFNFGQPGGRALIVTNAQFVSQEQWLSSDYLLGRLGYDATRVQQRLGDALYEQQLIGQQISAVTGGSRLGQYADNETQYLALMDAGAAYMQRFDLALGVGLTAQQMASLTTDIVLMVDVVVQTPNGPQHALAPVVYLANVGQNDLTSTGTISAGSLSIRTTDGLANSGVIRASLSSDIRAGGDLTNTGMIAGGQVSTVTAGRDLISNGGSFTGGDLTLAAGRDVLLNAAPIATSYTSHGTLATSTSHQVSTVDASGNLKIVALGAITSQGAQLSAADSATLLANGAITLTAVTDVTNSITMTGTRKNGSTAVVHDETVRGTSLTAGGPITVAAGLSDPSAKLTIVGSTVSSEMGAVALSGAGGVEIGTVTEHDESSLDTRKTKSGLLSKKTTITHEEMAADTAIGSTISGASVSITSANGNIAISGSNVVADGDVALLAKGNVSIAAAENRLSESETTSVKKSGLSLSGGGLFVGSAKVKTASDTGTVANSGSLVGSSGGNVTIQAGGAIAVRGSDVVSPGTTSLAGRSITVEHVTDSVDNLSSSKSSSFGLSLGVQVPVLNAANTVISMAQTATKGDNRTAAVAGLAGGLALANGVDAAKDIANTLATGEGSLGVQLSASVGFSKSKSSSESHDETVRGSTIGGRDVILAATGAGQNSTISVIGSNVTASRDVTVTAPGAITIAGAAETDTASGQAKSSGASLGVAVGLSLPKPGEAGAGPSVSASYSASKSHYAQADVTHREATVAAGGSARVTTGDTLTLDGATLSGNRVEVDAQDLAIASRQDTSTYDAKSSGFGISAGLSGAGVPSVAGNVSVGKQKGDFASVQEQAGIQAGDGGFGIRVTDDTDLKGGVIASTADASKNSLSTGTLTSADIENRESYKASQLGLGGGLTFGPRSDVGKTKEGDATVGTDRERGLPGVNLGGGMTGSAQLPIALSASGSQGSTTHSAIASGTITITSGDMASQQVAGMISRDTYNANAAVTQKFTEEKRSEIADAFDAARTLANETGTFLANKAKDAGDTKNGWEPGGKYNQIVTALTTAAGGNVTRGLSGLAQQAVVSYVQQNAAALIGEFAHSSDNAGTTSAAAALHAIIGCAGAAAGSGSCGSGAMGAAASSLIGALVTRSTSTTTSTEEKLAIANLIETLVTGATAASGLDPSSALGGATAEVNNNTLGQTVALSGGTKVQFSQGENAYDPDTAEGRALLVAFGGDQAALDAAMACPAQGDSSACAGAITPAQADAFATYQIAAGARAGGHPVTSEHLEALDLGKSLGLSAVQLAAIAALPGAEMSTTILPVLRREVQLAGANPAATWGLLVGASAAVALSYTVAEQQANPLQTPGTVITLPKPGGYAENADGQPVATPPLVTLPTDPAVTNPLPPVSVANPILTPPLTTPDQSGTSGGSVLQSHSSDKPVTVDTSISTAKADQATAPRDLNEQIIWNQVVANPGAGSPLRDMNNDSRFSLAAGWQKMQATARLPDGSSITIHYQYNASSNTLADIKFVSGQPVPPVLQPGPSVR